MKRREFVKTMSVAGAGLLLQGRSPIVLRAEETKPDPEVKRVLVMFKCHFDAGFIDTQYNVVHKYFNQYFPHAIEIARAANAGGKRRYVWTTGSWLLFEYLEQASTSDRQTMEEAIARGDITWQTEMMDQSMIEGGLALSQSLDKRFGKVTTGAKMTDVPGHTRGIIPPLAKHGVTFLEIGVNGGRPVATLPPILLSQRACETTTRGRIRRRRSRGCMRNWRRGSRMRRLRRAICLTWRTRSHRIATSCRLWRRRLAIRGFMDARAIH